MCPSSAMQLRRSFQRLGGKPHLPPSRQKSPIRRRQYLCTKRWYMHTMLHQSISQKTLVYLFTATITSLTWPDRLHSAAYCTDGSQLILITTEELMRLFSVELCKSTIQFTMIVILGRIFRCVSNLLIKETTVKKTVFIINIFPPPPWLSSP
jgi:hypothetical protein